MKKALKIFAACLIFLFFGLYALFLNFPKFVDINSCIEKVEKVSGLNFEFENLANDIMPELVHRYHNKQDYKGK